MANQSKNLTRRGLLGGAMLFGLASSACGYILYPERRGRGGGYIDRGPFIVDLIWLLPGLLPGLICLAVDFGTGCIYTSGGRADGDGPAAPPREPMQVAVELHGKQVARGELGPDGRAQLVWSENADVESLRAHGRIIATGRGDDQAQAHLRDLI